MLQKIFTLTVLFPVITNALCQSGAIYDSDSKKCFAFYESAVARKSAESICGNTGGHLASVHNMIDNTFLTKQAQQLIYADGPVWLGAISKSEQVNKPSYWSWSDNTAFDYQNYRTGQPSAFGVVACMQFLAGTGKWLTALCTDETPFICQTDAGSTPITTCPPVTPVYNCPSGYSWFNETNACYKSVRSTGVYDAAISACQKEGANLASIHSEAENNFLIELAKTGMNYTDPHHFQDTFIGLIYKNNAWIWSDGTSLDYTNWASGEPNNMNTEFVTSIMADPTSSSYNPNGGQWNNVASTKTERGYICKKSL